jgi:hypothetical protein
MGSPMSQEPTLAPEMKFCVDCGQKILRRAEICPGCGCRQVAAPKTLPFMSIGFTTIGLIACAGIIFYLIAAWIIDAISEAAREQSLAPFLKFCVIFFLGIKGLVREMRHRP